MKKRNVVTKIVVGLVLGMGALIVAPKAAHASTPCTPDIPPSYVNSSPCPLPGTTSFIVQSQEEHVVGDYDLDGDCDKETTYWVHNGYLICSGVANGNPFTNTPCVDKYYFIIV